jgi:broad specificity phosphatase PhoE/predicted kinase
MVLVMVGLPARGKTYTARKLARYLNWRGMSAKVFNVGNYRRRLLGSTQPHRFFDPSNPDGVAARSRMATAALDDLLDWMADGGNVGIYDATNGTRERRQLVLSRCQAAGWMVIFVESVCNDDAIIDSNVRQTKLSSPDYVDSEPDTAVRDFRQRIAEYEKAYEPVTEDYSYIRIEDVGRHVVAHRLRGYLPGRLLSFLMNLHIAPRPIFITRHGQSNFNLEDRVGGDSGLTDAGRGYAQNLASWVETHVQHDALQVWTSTLRRAKETAAPLGRETVPWRVLDEIEAGICDGLTYGEIAERYPAEFAARADDKLTYRYPRGESYQDVIARLDPVIVELERQKTPVLVIAHQAVLRALYAYFVDRPAVEVPHLKVPLHTVIELLPRTYGCDEERYPLSNAMENT